MSSSGSNGGEEREREKGKRWEVKETRPGRGEEKVPGPC